LFLQSVEFSKGGHVARKPGLAGGEKGCKFPVSCHFRVGQAEHPGHLQRLGRRGDARIPLQGDGVPVGRHLAQGRQQIRVVLPIRADQDNGGLGGKSIGICFCSCSRV
jgi:hypothetical protein